LARQPQTVDPYASFASFRSFFACSKARSAASVSTSALDSRAANGRRPVIRSRDERIQECARDIVPARAIPCKIVNESVQAVDTIFGGDGCFFHILPIIGFETSAARFEWLLIEMSLRVSSTNETLQGY